MDIKNALIRAFLFFDRSIYTAIGAVYNLLIEIAGYEIFTSDQIASFSRRIYALIGIFMLFKLTFSLITYIVNPDEMADKTKGLGALGKNVIISLGLIVLVPYIFAEAMNLQEIILREKTIEALVFGEQLQTSAVSKERGKNMIPYILFTQFSKPNPIVVGDKCDELYSDENPKDGNFDYVIDDEGRETLQYKLNEECFAELKTLFGDDETAYKNYESGLKNQQIVYLTKENIYTAVYKDANGDEEHIIEYQIIIPTIIGIVVLVVLISFCMDIALRTIKLAFYQIIAPIPIISYCDPKSGKDGLFKKWVKACVSTYLSLFIRLAALWLAVYIILATVNNFKFQGWASIFIVIGALMFAKEMPKILSDITGMKMDGFTIDPFRKLEKDALGGKILKKPNDFLQKVHAAPAALALDIPATGAKKIIGGIDAARHGKGFAQGMNRTHGKLTNAFYKKLDEWAPDSAEIRKNERLGKEEVGTMKSNWAKGKHKAQKLEGIASHAGHKSVYDVFDGKNYEAYKTVYNDKDFIRSKMALDRKDEARKALTNISESTARGMALRDALISQRENIENNDEALYNKFFDTNGNVKANVDMTTFIKAREDTSKAVQGMEKVHESLRKQNYEDARTEDEIKFVKYNPTDPTGHGGTYTGAVTPKSSGSSSSSGGSDNNDNNDNDETDANELPEVNENTSLDEYYDLLIQAYKRITEIHSKFQDKIRNSVVTSDQMNQAQTLMRNASIAIHNGQTSNDINEVITHYQNAIHWVNSYEQFVDRL